MSENAKRRRLRPLLSGAVLRSQTDERLCGLAATGSEQAFGAIFERYRRELRRHAARMVRPDRADDVLQQAMLSAWTALLAGPQITDVRPWLHRVVHNAALDTVARRGYDDAGLHDSTIAPSLTDQLAEGRLTAGAALAALAALPENQRRALTLTAIEGRSGQEAALALGISESATRQLVYRARSGVRAAVSALTPLPLINWLVAAGATSAPPAVAGVAGGGAATAAAGLAGGGAATAAKVIAVLGVTATIGVTHHLQAQPSPRPHRAAPASREPGTADDRGRPAVAQQVALVEPATLITARPHRLPSAGRQAPGAGPGGAAGQSAAGQAGGNEAGPQVSAPNAIGRSEQASSAEQGTASSGDGGSLTQQDPPTTDHGAPGQPALGPTPPPTQDGGSSGSSGVDPSSSPANTTGNSTE